MIHQKFLLVTLCSLSMLALSNPVRAQEPPAADKPATTSDKAAPTSSEAPAVTTPAAEAAPAAAVMDSAKPAKKHAAKADKKADKKIDKKAAGNPTAIIKTSMGDIEVTLYADKAPKTVENFIGLATGKKDWKDAKTGKEVKGKPLYNGTILHRVIPGFMIQGGDPMGNGTGGPGYEFADEFNPTAAFDKPYYLAMANAGPNTNGSQFFITVAPTPHLNGKHTLFGEVTKGQSVVDKIAGAARDPGDKPLKDIVINKIVIKK